MSVEDVFRIKRNTRSFIEEWEKLKLKTDPLIEGWIRFIEER